MEWIRCADRLPPNPKDYSELKNYIVAIKLTGGFMGYYVLSWADGWNCTIDNDGNINKEYEMTVDAWAEITPYKETQEEDVPIGEQIKQARKKRKISQGKLAEMTGLTRQTIGNYETGVREPTGKSLVKIAEALNKKFKYTFTVGGTEVIIREKEST